MPIKTIKNRLAISIIRPAIISAIILFLLFPAQSAFAGSIVGWLRNNEGQCNIPSPNSSFIDISAGEFHSLGLKQDGSIIAWGRNTAGQCNVPSPNNGFIAISAGGYHSLGLKQDGSIVAWGRNEAGQSNLPSSNVNFIAITAGYDHNLGLKRDGSIVAWGCNGYGQLNIPSPNSGFIAISAGGDYSLGLKQDGSIIGWGRKTEGQCTIPSPNADFVAISAGYYHSLGLKKNGSIVGWGDNSYGQRNIPSPNSSFISISAGGSHSLGLKNDGSIVAWGDNSYGQRNIPSPNSGFIALDVGCWHSLALKATGNEVLLKRCEINQCFQNVNEIDSTTQMYDLIETKPFVVRVNLERYWAGTTTGKVKLSIVNAKTGEPVGKPPVKEKNATIKYGSSEAVDFLFNDNETQDMKASDYKFSLVVEDNKGTKLFDWSHIYTFKSSKTMKVLVVTKVVYNFKTANWNDNYLSFVENVFPVPKNQIEVVPVYLPPVSVIHPAPIATEMLGIFALHWIYTPSWEKPPDFICAVLPKGTLGEGGKGGGPLAIIDEGDGAEYRLAHEIGHVYGLGDEYVITKKKIIGSTEPWEITGPSFDFDRNPPPLTHPSETGKYKIKRWTSIRYYDKRCDENPDKSTHPDFYEIDEEWDEKTQEWKPFRDSQGNLLSCMWCSGNYVQNGGYDLTDEEDSIPSLHLSKYCSMMSSSARVWISGPEYSWLLKKFVEAKSTVGSNSLGTGITTTLQEQKRMLIRGLVNIPEKTAELCPLIPAPNLELTPEVSEPNCQLVFLSKTMLKLGTFRFLPFESEGNILDGLFFLVVDLPVDTALLQVLINGIVAADLRLTDNSPTVKVLSPNGGEVISSEMAIAWSASDSDGDKLKYIIEFSNNNGAKWSPIAIDQNTTELVVDSNYLPGSSNCLVKVIASDGWNRSEDISDASFSIATKPPKVNILEPEDGSILLWSPNMQGRCTAYDPETGYITGPNAIVWSSDIDGFLGKGNLVGFKLSLGNHLLSATATDPEGKTATGTDRLTVIANRSDLNRDLHVNFFDWAKFAQRWNETCSEPNWCEGTDLNRNGSIEFSDIAGFVENWLWERQVWDFDIDEDVDFADLDSLTEYWLKPHPAFDIAPSGSDGIVNFLDFAALADHWLEGTTP